MIVFNVILGALHASLRILFLQMNLCRVTNIDVRWLYMIRDLVWHVVDRGWLGLLGVNQLAVVGVRSPCLCVHLGFDKTCSLSILHMECFISEILCLRQ